MLHIICMLSAAAAAGQKQMVKHYFETEEKFKMITSAMIIPTSNWLSPHNCRNTSEMYDRRIKSTNPSTMEWIEAPRNMNIIYCSSSLLSNSKPTNTLESLLCRAFAFPPLGNAWGLIFFLVSNQLIFSSFFFNF